MRILFILLVTAFVLTLAIIADLLLAATRYVSPSGSNTPPYGTWEAASHTISAAVATSSGYDIVIVGTGTYSPDSGEQFPIYLGRAVEGIRIAGAGGAASTIVDAGLHVAMSKFRSCPGFARAIRIRSIQSERYSMISLAAPEPVATAPASYSTMWIRLAAGQSEVPTA